MNDKKTEFQELKRKPIIIYKYEYEINESCLTCRHLLFDWKKTCFCGLGRNIYGFCDQPEPKQNEVVDYD